MQRRQLLLSLGGATTALTLAGGGWRLFHSSTAHPLILSARNDIHGQHYAVGYYLDGSQAFATPVTERCHDVYIHPWRPLGLFMGRRPSRESYLVDLRNGHLLQILSAGPGRHFYGHGIFHPNGDDFYTTENDIHTPGRGVIGHYRLQGQQLIHSGELSSHGIGPHQLLWMPDHETLVVANGGIRTEADSREKMNLNAMEPSLVLMRRTGELISKEQLPDAMNSIRHLAVAQDGTIVSGQQYEGDPLQKVPLVAIKRPGQPFQPFAMDESQRLAMQQYTASLAIHDRQRLLAVTAPRGNRLFIWQLDTQALLLEAPLPDCAGVDAVEQGFVVTSGQGRCRLYDCQQLSRIQVHPLELPAGLWDNHLRVAAMG